MSNMRGRSQSTGGYTERTMGFDGVPGQEAPMDWT